MCVCVSVGKVVSSSFSGSRVSLSSSPVALCVSFSQTYSHALHIPTPLLYTQTHSEKNSSTHTTFIHWMLFFHHFFLLSLQRNRRRAIVFSSPRCKLLSFSHFIYVAFHLQIDFFSTFSARFVRRFFAPTTSSPSPNAIKVWVDAASKWLHIEMYFGF